MPFLISLLISLYLSTHPGMFFPFFNTLLLSNMSNSSVGIQSFFLCRCLPRIILAVSFTTLLKLSVNVSMSVFSSSRVVIGANFPVIIAWNASVSFGG